MNKLLDLPIRNALALIGLVWLVHMMWVYLGSN